MKSWQKPELFERRKEQKDDRNSHLEELHPVRGEGECSVQEFGGCQVQAQLVGLDLIPWAFGFAHFAVAPVVLNLRKKSH